jgi:hypothetical protein
MGTTEAKDLPMLYSVFKLKSKEEQKEILTGYLDKYTVPQLAELWISQGLPSRDMIYHLRRNLGIPYEKRERKRKDMGEKNTNNEVESRKKPKYSLTLDGSIEGNELATYLESFKMGIDKEKKYVISLLIEEY